MRINERGYWEDTDGHGVDPLLAIAIANFLNKENCINVLDLGCGNGFYTNVINNSGIPCIGVDGNPMTKFLAGQDFYIADLTIPHDFGNFDWVLSLEVGEHIPAKYEDIYLQNINYCAIRGAIVSWAIPGQGGDGHVNTKSNLEVINKFQKLGFICDIEDTDKLRSSASPYPEVGWWFRNTLHVFRRKEKE